MLPPLLQWLLPWLLPLLARGWKVDPCSEEGSLAPTGKTCTINDLAQWETHNTEIYWDGDLVLMNSSLSMPGKKLMVNATGILTIQQCNITLGREIFLSGGGGVALQRSALQAADVRLLSGDGNVVVDATEITGDARVLVEALNGGVNAYDDSLLFSRKQIAIFCRVASLSLAEDAIQAQSVRVEAKRLLQTNTQGSRCVKGRLKFVHIRLYSWRIILGTSCSIWQVGKLEAIADILEIENGGIIQAEGLINSCHQRTTEQRSQCSRYMEGLEAEVDFDLVLVARKNLTVRTASDLKASSFLVCAELLALQRDVSLSASGRGCPPGEGLGQGTTIDNDPLKPCGAGGGSNFGAGGCGGQYVAQFSECAEAKPAVADFQLYPWQAPPPLPAGVASGGGCGISTKSCQKLRSHPERISSGGGLLWLEAQNVMLDGPAYLKADGSDGSVQPNKNILLDDGRHIVTYGVTGGGAGGHVLFFATSLQRTSPSAVLHISAEGGNGKFDETTHAVSGGGGGGFVGLGWAGQASEIQAISPFVSASAKGGSHGFNGQTLGCCNHTVGQAGSVTALLPCPPGHAGPFCAPCPAGFWSSAGISCERCKNMEGGGMYIGEAAATPDCPYECPKGTINKRINPRCLGLSQFAMTYSQVTLVYLPAAFVLLLFGLHYGCQGRWLHIKTTAGLHFERRLLPCHFRRVFLAGRNCPTAPWLLGNRPVDDLLDQDVWEELARLVDAVALYHRTEELLHAMLGAICPPMGALLALRRRWQRARDLQQRLHIFSEDVAGPTFLRQQRCEGGVGVLQLVFGCDDGATLGYIDFLDPSVDPMDWAPADLRQEARLLPARGDGSYFEPWSLDGSDVLLQELVQAGFNPAHVRRLVAAFNQNAHVLPAVHGELDALALGRLQDTVEACARDTGLAGHVHVMLCATRTPSLRPSQGSSPDKEPAASFSTLVQQQHRKRDDLVRAMSLSNVMRRTSSAAASKLDFRVCLVFLDLSAAQATLPSDRRVSVQPGAGTDFGLLSSPLPYCQLRQHEVGVQPSSSRRTSQSRDRWSLRVLALLKSGGRSVGVKVSVLSLLVFLTGLDAAWCSFVGQLLCWLDATSFGLWFLVPPLAPLCSSVACALFVLFERPRWGRLSAAMVVVSMINLPVALVLRAGWLSGASWYFQLQNVLFATLLKTGLACAVHGHCLHLEVARDLGCTNAQDLNSSMTWRHKASSDFSGRLHFWRSRRSSSSSMAEMTPVGGRGQDQIEFRGFTPESTGRGLTPESAGPF